MLRVTESDLFVEGGPTEDDGQTGGSLVMGFHGPHVGSGGGALSGNDPWRLDRAGTLRARQVAMAMVETACVSKARGEVRATNDRAVWWRKPMVACIPAVAARDSLRLAYDA